MHSFLKHLTPTHVFVLCISMLSIGTFITGYVIGDPNSRYIDYLDWRLHLSWAASARKTILEYGQIPLWNPFRCGGVPGLGDPESDLLSLYLPFLLYLGPTYGYIALFYTSLCIGLFGFYLLARWNTLSHLASIFAGTTYMFSGLYIIPFSVGMTNFISVCYIPFVALFYEKYLKSNFLPHAITSAFFLALMFLSGFHYIPIILLYIATLSLWKAIYERNWIYVQHLGIVVGLFVSFSAIKLLQSLDILFHNASTFTIKESFRGFSVGSLLYSLINRNQSFQDFAIIKNVKEPSLLWGASYDLDENGMYVGVFTLLFFIFGFVKSWRSKLAYAVIGVIFLYISLGTNIFPSLYAGLKSLPFFENMRVAQRYRYIFMIPFVIFAGFGFDHLFRRSLVHIVHSEKIRTSLAVLVWLIITIDILYVSLSAVRITPPVSHIRYVTQDFHQVCLQKIEYVTVMRNLGNVQCVDNVIYPVNAVCQQNEAYKGLVYLAHAQKKYLLQFSHRIG